MTTYDDIYTEFLTKCKTDSINLPSNEMQIYDAIHSAIRHFNNRLRDDLGWDDQSEIVDRELNNDELTILAHFLRLSFLENQHISFTTLWQPFQSDIGLRNYQSQVKSLESLIAYENKVIDGLINNMQVDYL